MQMDEAKRTESHMTSPAAFVQGGIQDACDDSCSICLEGFCDSDPSTVTSCNHEFHFQCVLEWCQRSSNCPMCWQNISLKDPGSQELLDAVERERSIRFPPLRNARIFHHPTLGDFELPDFPVGVNDAELEDRIIQQLSAVVGRRHRASRREGSRGRLPVHTHSQFVVHSTHPNGSSTGSGEETEANSVTEINGGTQHMYPSVNGNQISASSSQSSLPTQDRAGPSEFHSISDNWKSRFSSISRYKESISKSTKELKEKLFSRSPTMADIGSEVRREVNAGIATVSRMMERLETRDSNSIRPTNNSPVATDRRSNNTDNPNDDIE